jgi:site-specific recombinase XerD
MYDLLAPQNEPAVVEPKSQLSTRAAFYAAHSMGDGTRAAYGKAWRAYVAWCEAQSLVPLSGNPRQIANYLTARADLGLSASSIGIAAAAIKEAHRLDRVSLDWDDPDLSMVREGVRRRLGTRARRQSAPATHDVLARLLDTRQGPETFLGARDRAMLVIGFHGALRRSELVALDMSDVAVDPGKGVVLTIRRSKTDQDGAGRVLALAANPANPECCPIVALERWLKWRRRVGDEGALFTATRHGYLTSDRLVDKVVARLVKDAAECAGLDPQMYSAHCLRSGFATEAAKAGVSLDSLMRQTRHTTPEMAMSYIRVAERWDHNASVAVVAKLSQASNSSSKGPTDA